MQPIGVSKTSPGRALAKPVRESPWLTSLPHGSINHRPTRTRCAYACAHLSAREARGAGLGADARPRNPAMRKGSVKCTPLQRGRYRAGFRKPPGDARCASCAVLSRRTETAFRPPPHDLARPSASPDGLGRLLRSLGKLGKLWLVVSEKRAGNFQRFPNPPEAVSQSAGDGQRPCDGDNDT